MNASEHEWTLMLDANKRLIGSNKMPYNTNLKYSTIIVQRSMLRSEW